MPMLIAALPPKSKKDGSKQLPKGGAKAKRNNFKDERLALISNRRYLCGPHCRGTCAQSILSASKRPPDTPNPKCNLQPLALRPVGRKRLAPKLPQSLFALTSILGKKAVDVAQIQGAEYCSVIAVRYKCPPENTRLCS